MSTMEEDTEFRDLIIKKLENNGVLLKMKAAIRGQIYNLLENENKHDDSPTNSITNNDSSSTDSYDNTTNVALSLIQDLLECLSLDATKSIFKAESGEQAKYSCQSRAELIETLQLNDGCDEGDQMTSFNNCKPVPILVKYLTKNGVVSKSGNETFVAASTSTSNSTE